MKRDGYFLGRKGKKRKQKKKRQRKKRQKKRKRRRKRQRKRTKKSELTSPGTLFNMANFHLTFILSSSRPKEVFIVNPAGNLYYNWLFIITLPVMYNWTMIIAR